ncbi:MAG: hypothetical protein Aureis2KO_28560 [Aureisphaera sp.]
MLQKGFLRAKNNIHISRGRYVRAILWGIAATLGIYIFLCALREGFRALEFGTSNGPLLFDKVARTRQNVSYALISAVFGNSIFLGTLFMSPIKGTLRKYRRLTILNDQIFLGGNFLHLFFKMFALIGILACIDMLPYFVEHMYIFYLFAVVLFLESWKHIRKVFKGKAFKPMVINLLILSLLVFAISRTSIFNYQKLDEALLAGNPKVETPISSFESVEWSWRPYYLKMYAENGIIKYNLNQEFVSFDQIQNRIAQLEMRTRPELVGQIPVHILASGDLPISELKKVENELAYTGIFKIRYITQKPKTQFTGRYELEGLNYRITEMTLNALEMENRFKPEVWLGGYVQINWEELESWKIVEIDIHDSIYVNGEEYSNRSELLRFFKDHINASTGFNIKYQPSTSFQNYISVLSIYKQALFELRSQMTTVTWEESQYGVGKIRELYKLEQREAKKEYPYTLLENFNFSKLEK